MACRGMTSGWFDNDSGGPLRQSDIAWGRLDDLWRESDKAVAAAPWSNSPPSREPFRGRSHWEGIAAVEKRRPELPVGSDAAIFAAEHENEKD